MTRPARGERRPRESLAERRAKKAEVDDPAIVLEAALRFLEARPRSVAEVRRRLIQAGYREDLVMGAIERLGDLGVLDDEAFATQWVESRDRAHPRGEHALMIELRQKGIEAPLIAKILRERREAAVRWDAEAGETSIPEAEPQPSADEAAARRLLARHSRALERVVDLRARRQRAYALLARNGFGPEIAATISRELSSVDTEPSEP
ncbi:MAG TPA: regulatory protein RecX [Candidatus Limnocylindrales bacterium]|nr:regulatory protein RecX [Candidatus Limnocylindrales bacterium]